MAYERWKKSTKFDAKCHLCNTHFNDYELYVDHLKTHYVSDKSILLDNGKKKKLKWLTCDKCGKESAHTSNFISHIARHTLNPPFKCALKIKDKKTDKMINCTSQASTQQNLKTHIKITHGIDVHYIKDNLRLKPKTKPKPIINSGKKRTRQRAPIEEVNVFDNDTDNEKFIENDLKKKVKEYIYFYIISF